MSDKRGSDNYPSPGRTMLLIRERLYEDGPALAIGAGAIFALNLLSIAMGSTPFMNGARSGFLWSAVVFVGALFLAAKAFSPMHGGRSGTEWLLLPASALEKYLAIFLSYGILYPILASLGGFVLSALLALVGSIVGVGGGIIWNPLAGASLERGLSFLFCLSFALAGSARFRKLPLLKTGATLFTFGIALSFLFLLLFLFVTPEGRLALANHHFSVNFGTLSIDEGTTELAKWLGRFFIAVSVVLSNLYALFLVEEKEAKDEVQ